MTNDELDLLIAQKIMDWRLAPTAKGLAYPDDNNPSGDYIIVRGRPERFEMGSYPEVFTRQWTPSTNIEHAWEVVERLYSVMFYLSISTYHGCHPDELWVVTYGHMLGGGEDKEIAKTAPLAICRAALKAWEPR